MGAPRYMFVVKDADSKSFSRSDDLERRLIHRHVSISSIHQRRLSPGQAGNLSQQLPFIEVKPKAKDVRSHKRAVVGRSNASATSRPSVGTSIACRCHIASKI